MSEFDLLLVAGGLSILVVCLFAVLNYIEQTKAIKSIAKSLDLMAHQRRRDQPIRQTESIWTYNTKPLPGYDTALAGNKEEDDGEEEREEPSGPPW